MIEDYNISSKLEYTKYSLCGSISTRILYDKQQFKIVKCTKSTLSMLIFLAERAVDFVTMSEMREGIERGGIFVEG